MMAASVLTGMMNPLLGKIPELFGEEYKKLAGVREQASVLRDELSAMKALLDKMELMDKLDPLAKNWRDHVREMSYDMENCIDDFMHNINRVHAKDGFVNKMIEFLSMLRRRHRISNQIEELKVLAMEANARRKRYKIDDCVGSSPGVVAIDPRISVIYKDAAGLVGIDGPREELVSLLMDSRKKLKVVSIVGFGGLGKTTLAKQVYDEIGGQFDSEAFVSVTQRPDMKSLLIGLQRKLGMGESYHSHELQDIIDRLREYLKHQRYVIVVDDLWDQSTWNIISCAFPENSNGSRVMVTTRLDDVALLACHHDRAYIYRVKPLKEQDARRLFFNRLYGSENVCPPQFKEVAAEILKKCGGLPLAVITIASLLANHEARSLNEWNNIKNSLGAKVATETTLQEMRGILNLSYMHLPVYLRPCFLYLGMYHEDHEIEKDDLIRQWIAEGFICSLLGVDLDDVAERYFNELINRSLIQPERTIYGDVRVCRVHDIILDSILGKSTEDNFISVAHNNEEMAGLHSCEHKVRRLTLKSTIGCATSETSSATSLSQVRSYARFGESDHTPPLSQFKYLRVLFFEFPRQWDATVDLTAIGHLFLLRYLKVLARSAGVALPVEIQGLVHLETLELVCRSAESFPSDVTRLANLSCLILPYREVLPEGTQNMKSIRTLHCSGMSESSLEDIKGLSKLINLKKLKLSTPDDQCLTVEKVDALVSAIGVLQYLKQLSLSYKIESVGYDSRLYSLPDPPPRLEVLELRTWEFSRVPKWVGELRCLRILCLHVLHLSTDEVRVLGELPSLVNGCFHVFNISQDKVVVSKGLFPVLDNVWFLSDEDVTTYLSFEAEAMPKLQTLNMGFGWKEWRGATPVGMECLPCLQEIHVWVQYTSTKSSKNQEDVLADIESAFKRAASVHPGHPSVRVYSCDPTTLLP